MKPILFLLSLLSWGLLSAQWTESSLELTSSGTSYTKIQFAEHTWSGSHAILFNAYKNISVSGGIGSNNNTNYANNAGAYGGGAGAIAFYANGGTMDFLISPAAGVSGKDTGIQWGVPKMRIHRTGSVGIGTTDIAGYKLSVAGNIRATEIKVDSYPWPDYVFSADYPLKSLPEIKAFITKNNHLPNMPSAEQVEENGIALGEMNALLLEKIEELTLYTIQQQETIEELKNELKDNGENLSKRVAQLEKLLENTSNETPAEN